MNSPRYLPVIVFLAFVAVVLTCVSVSAQGGGKSLAELNAQAQKIKVGESTEGDVIALLGQPSKTWEGDVPIKGAREFRTFKKLIYGPQRDITVIIDMSTGKVHRVDFKPTQ